MKRIARGTTIALVPVLVLCLTLVLGLVLSPAARAQEDEGTSTTGRFVLGYRNVDISGTENKYKEDYNLYDGPRLMDLDFNLTPDGTLKDMVDRIQLTVSDFGDDPFQSLHLAVDKYGSYSFQFNHWKSTYFYNDTILPEALADERTVTGGDFHTFDFDRVRNEAKLKLNLSPRAELNFGFNEYTKTGRSTTTLDLQRLEIELDKPIDETEWDYNAGFQYSWDKVTLVLDEQYGQYKNAIELFLPGQATGGLTELNYYFLDQPYDYTTWSHTARVVAKPTDNFTVRASGTLQTLSMDVSANERSGGTTFQGAPLDQNDTGNGSISRDNDLFDLDLDYVINDRFAVVGGYYYRKLSQDGSFLFAGVRNFGKYDIETNGGEGGLQVTLSPALTLTGGVRYETRDVKLRDTENGGPLDTFADVGTDHQGYFANLGWRPSKLYRVTVDYEDSTFNDPFTLASPTDRSRLRATGKVNLDNGFWANGTYSRTDYKNSDSGWDALTEQYLGRIGYRIKQVNASVGYSRVKFDRNIDQTVFFGSNSQLFLIGYGADSDFYDGLVRWQATPALSLGGQYAVYSNSGSFALDRDDYKAFGEYKFTQGYLVRVAYRHIKYNEKAFNFDDYNANIYDFGVGYTW